MTVLRFPLERARPSNCGRVVCCEGAAVLVLPVIRIERGPVEYCVPTAFPLSDIFRDQDDLDSFIADLDRA